MQDTQVWSLTQEDPTCQRNLAGLKKKERKKNQCNITLTEQTIKQHDLKRYRKSTWQNPTPFQDKTKMFTPGIEGNFINLIKAIYRKSTVHIVLNG